MNITTPFTIYGKPIDEQTRCEHYNSALDVIAIKMACCKNYYPCILCHNETAGHTATVWPKEAFDVKAVLCGSCKTEMSINEYFSSNATCPSCGAAFNPSCSKHYHLYFKID